MLFILSIEKSSFAIDLLIPSFVLNNLIFEEKIKYFDKLSILLDVSKSSLIYQVKRLNII